LPSIETFLAFHRPAKWQCPEAAPCIAWYVEHIKIVHPAKETVAATPGNIMDAYGYRYFTISVSNLQEMTDACANAGHKVVIAPVEVRPGVTISIVNDPDGNLVEFLQAS
jgi:catechol 2,3-dioxygenase-like lactoylglutathione lyase family enzyme